MKRISKKDWSIMYGVIWHFMEYKYSIHHTAEELIVLNRHAPGVFKITDSKLYLVGKIPTHIELLYWKERAIYYQKSYYSLAESMQRVLDEF